MDQKRIGEFISKLRKEKNMTQKDLAEKMNVSINAVSKWERGISLMDISLLKPLSELLGVTIVELLSGEIIDDDIEKAYEVVENTLKYSDKKIKKEKFKLKRVVIALLVIFVFGLFITYKGILLYSINQIHEGIDENINEKHIKKSEIKEDLIITRKKTDNLITLFNNIKMENIFVHATQTGELYDRIFYSFDNGWQMMIVIREKNNYDYMEERYGFNIVNMNHYFEKYNLDNTFDMFKFISKYERKNYNIFTPTYILRDYYFKSLMYSLHSASFDYLRKIKGDLNGYLLVNDNFCNYILYDGIYEYNITITDFNKIEDTIEFVSTIEFIYS